MILCTWQRKSTSYSHNGLGNDEVEYNGYRPINKEIDYTTLHWNVCPFITISFYIILYYVSTILSSSKYKAYIVFYYFDTQFNIHTKTRWKSLRSKVLRITNYESIVSRLSHLRLWNVSVYISHPNFFVPWSIDQLAVQIKVYITACELRQWSC